MSKGQARLKTCLSMSAYGIMEMSRHSTQTFVCFWQQTCQPHCPFALAALILDEILADLDQRMRQAAPFAMYRNSVIRGVADDVWRVITDEKIVIGIKQRQQRTCETRIAVVKHASMPRATYSFEHRREAVQRDQSGRQACALATI